MSMGEQFVMKCGGSTLAALPELFFKDLQLLQESGHTPIIVHGGGPAISAALERFGIATEFVDGLRKTTDEILDIVEMVLAGQINKLIVRRILAVGGQAWGISGTDGGLLQAKPVANHDKVGWVGEVTDVNTKILSQMVDASFIPVIAPIGIDSTGQRYNINADTAAGGVAAKLGVERLVMVTDVPGVMKEVNGQKQIQPRLERREIEELIASGEIYGGMIPKVKAALHGLAGGVKEVAIVDGAEPNVLSRLVQGETLGTVIYQS